MLTCRFCSAPLQTVFADLGHQPPSNAYLTAEALQGPELTYPLTAYACDACRLVQVPAHAAADALFDANYAYFSSVSRSWLAHARSFVADAVPRFALGSHSFVVEVASNDGYLLQYVAARGIPCLGIEPTASTAAAARDRGIATEEVFLGARTGQEIASRHRPADLVVANNVLAHVPDPGDFLAGVAALLAPQGVVSFEFPHLLDLVRNAQFDTIYHEHYSYLSLGVVQAMLRRAGLAVFDVARLPTHGGSLRVFACRAGARAPLPSVAALLDEERAAGMEGDAFYRGFQARAETVKNTLLRFLLDARAEGRRVAGYGAAAKGNTLLNFAGIRRDLLPFVCDAAPSKQGKFLPGSHIPIRPPEALEEAGIDTVLILPWNIADEIRDQLSGTGARFVTAVPELAIA